ncbi:MAG: DUF262 domain-containing protein [Vampirovibrionales bacterium]
MAKNPHSLTEDIKRSKPDVQVTAFVSELDWYAHRINKGEIIINPDYQRTFVWSDEKQSRFIESLLLNLPIPPVYMIERSDGKRELLDGLQRICTYLRFTNQLDATLFKPLQETLTERIQSKDTDYDDEEDDEDSYMKDKTPDTPPEELPPLELDGCDIVTSLNGKTFEELDSSIQAKLHRKPLNCYVFESDDKELQYRMFVRMNSGGANLTKQQIRNAQIRILGSDFIDLVNTLARNSSYQALLKQCFKKDSTKHIKNSSEITLRLLAFRYDSSRYDKKIETFLDAFLKEATLNRLPNLDPDQLQTDFITTCELLRTNLDKKNPITIKKEAGKKGAKDTTFLYVLEVLFILVMEYLDHFQSNPQLLEAFSAKLNNLTAEDLKPFKGGGKNTKNFHTQRVDVIKKILELT